MGTTLRMGSPEEAGFDARRLAPIRERAPEWLASGRTRCFVALAARHGVVAFHEAFGTQTDAPDSPPLQTDGVWVPGSCCKPVVATALMLLVEEGRLSLNRPLKEYIPEISGKGTDEILVHHLLTHTAGYSDAEGMLEAWGKKLEQDGHPDTLEGFVDVYLRLQYDQDLVRKPGTEMEYCNLGYALAGEVAQRVAGMPFHDFARERIFEPLGMHDTSFVGNPVLDERRVKRGTTGYVDNFDADWWINLPFCYGSMSTTALDLAKFAQTFLNGGSYGEFRLLSRGAVGEMTRNQIPGVGTDFLGTLHPEASWGLGFMIQSNDRWAWMSATLTPVGTPYHGGAGGHVFWIDPVNEVVGVYLSVCTDVDPETSQEHAEWDVFPNIVTGAVVG